MSNIRTGKDSPLPAKRKKDDISKTPEYQKLLADIEKIVQEAAAQGVDITRRNDLLQCPTCGAYEDDSMEEGRIVCTPPAKTKPSAGHSRKVPGEFTLVDSREHVTHRGRTTHCKMTYDFICTVCGARQEQIFRNRFEN